MKVHGEGPIPARIMIVGEAPGDREEASGLPFQGVTGQELNRMLQEAGLMRSECFCTYVCRTRPVDNDFTSLVATKKKDITAEHVQLKGRWVTSLVLEGYTELLAEIERVQPYLIITLGNLPLWVLTGAWNVVKWRGSQLTTDSGVKLIPTLHPAMVFKDWASRALVISDLRRAKQHLSTREWQGVPNWTFTIRPSYPQVIERINQLLELLDAGQQWIEFDLETSIATRHIRCIGLSWSATEAISIPLTSSSNIEGYWTATEEASIVYGLYKLLTHPNALVRGQNLLFDCQYTYRYWHFIPRVAQDTMISHHSVFCALPKGLDFLSSMYCSYHKQWKLISWKGT